MTKRGQLTFYLPSNLPQLKCIKKNRLALNLEVKYETKTCKVQLKLSMQQLSQAANSSYDHLSETPFEP